MASIRAHVASFLVKRRIRSKLARITDVRDIRKVFGQTRPRLPREVKFRDGTIGGIPGEWAETAKAAKATMLYIHGGGFVACSPVTHRPITAALAKRGFRVFAPAYRLAPEHPFPAALDDTMGAYKQLLKTGIAPEDVVVSGDSAGGGLATALLLKAREDGLPMPAGLYLLSPWLDMATTAPSYDKFGAHDLIVSRDEIRRLATAYLGGKPDNAFTSPVRGDPTGLPPTLIQVSSEEVLLSDSLNFANRAAMAGVDMRLHVWPEMPHDWPLFHQIIRAGVAAIDEAGQWMQQRLHTARLRAAA
jgi:epsilon-lactone hydrolase